MAKQTFSPRQARAKSRAHPKRQEFKPGTAGPTRYGRGGGGGKLGKKMFQPGKRTGATGPENGKGRGRSWA